MVNEDMIDATFGALSDPTRRQIIERLLHGQASITELAEPHDMSLPAVMKHVVRLEKAGLVTREKHGRTVLCTLVPDHLDDAQRWLQDHLDFWNARLDGLGKYLEAKREQTK